MSSLKTDDCIGLLQPEVDGKSFLREDAFYMLHKQANLRHQVSSRGRCPWDSGPYNSEHGQIKGLEKVDECCLRVDPRSITEILLL